MRIRKELLEHVIGFLDDQNWGEVVWYQVDRNGLVFLPADPKPSVIYHVPRGEWQYESKLEAPIYSHVRVGGDWTDTEPHTGAFRISELKHQLKRQHMVADRYGYRHTAQVANLDLVDGIRISSAGNINGSLARVVQFDRRETLPLVRQGNLGTQMRARQWEKVVQCLKSINETASSRNEVLKLIVGKQSLSLEPVRLRYREGSWHHFQYHTDPKISLRLPHKNGRGETIPTPSLVPWSGKYEIYKLDWSEHYLSLVSYCNDVFIRFYDTDQGILDIFAFGWLRSTNHVLEVFLRLHPIFPIREGVEQKPLLIEV